MKLDCFADKDKQQGVALSRVEKATFTCETFADEQLLAALFNFLHFGGALTVQPAKGKVLHVTTVENDGTDP